MDETETGPRRTTLAVGTKVQSTPGPNEEPAIYETVAEIEARPRWNGLRPRLSRAQALSGTVTRLWRSEEHTSELQSLMRISYAVFCLKKKNITHETRTTHCDIQHD